MNTFRNPAAEGANAARRENQERARMLPREAGAQGVYLYSERYGIPKQGAYVDYFAPKTGEKRQAIVDEVITPMGHEAVICLVDDETGQEIEQILRPDPRG